VLVVPTGAYLTWNGQFIEGKGIKPDHHVAWSQESALRDGITSSNEQFEIVKGP
jgi:C-terminal processing protease CtpA/Prc